MPGSALTSTPGCGLQHCFILVMSPDRLCKEALQQLSHFLSEHILILPGCIQCRVCLSAALCPSSVSNYKVCRQTLCVSAGWEALPVPTHSMLARTQFLTYVLILQARNSMRWAPPQAGSPQLSSRRTGCWRAGSARSMTTSRGPAWASSSTPTAWWSSLACRPASAWPSRARSPSAAATCLAGTSPGRRFRLSSPKLRQLKGHGAPAVAQVL